MWRWVDGPQRVLGRITSLIVDEKHRGRGIDQMLVQVAECWFHSVGCVKAEVTSGDDRIDAHRFYEREAFSRDGQRLSKRIYSVATTPDFGPSAATHLRCRADAWMSV
jgi:GNAT superfamily N-acetyltransferase